MIEDDNYARLFAPSKTIEALGWRAELRNDELAEISFKGIPVLRAIRAVVRDQDWTTLLPVVRRVAEHESKGHKTLLLDIDYEGFGSRYTGELAIHLAPDELKVTFDGVAPAALRSNRIGLVVLHRADDAGRAVTIGSPGGGSTPSNFPVDISPHQPFMDISSVEWERDRTTFNLAFKGDTFETEDQRNWTDASFKTYSTPLSKPFPVDVAAGDRVHQSVVLRALQDAGSPRVIPGGELGSEQSDAVLTVLDGVVGPVPAMGVSASSGWTNSDDLLEPIPGLDALLVELQSGPGAEPYARRAVQQAKALGVPLDVRLDVESADHIQGLIELLPLENVIRLAVFDAKSRVTEAVLWEVLKSEAERRSFAGTLVAGARSHFTELNRNADRLPSDAPAFTYSITPQMHATEVPHIVQTLPIQRLTAFNALRISSGRPLHIGPVTLKARFNAVASADAVDAAAAEAAATDPLQREPFTAAWLLGSVAALSLPGVESLSYFEATGPRGISGADGLTPAGEILAALAALRGADVLGVDGAVPGLVLYPVRDDDRTVLFAANLTSDRLGAVVKLPGGAEGRLDLEPWTTVSQRVG